MPAKIRTFICAGLFLVGTNVFADEWVSEASNLHVDVSRVDGRVAMDLRGTIWIVPENGGQARALTDPVEHASRPRWSPDGTQILYQARDSQGTSLRVIDIASAQNEALNPVSMSDQFASWHPDGSRIVFASTRDGTDFDIWETDVRTGLNWRLTNDPGDEIEAVWSADGENLAYISVEDGVYSVMLRRGGQPTELVLSTNDALSSLSWRPDGTLLTVFRDDGTSNIAEMIILSEPALVREFIAHPQLQTAAVTWLDRSRHFFVADGVIKTRAFGEWQGRMLPFRALIESPEPAAPRTVQRRELAVVDAPDERLVIRGARLFDGIWTGYRNNMDVLIEAGKVVAIEPRQEWQNATVLDLGDVTVMPGFIDAWTALPANPSARDGARLLSYGITTIVADLPDAALPGNWESESTPGPRLLRATGLSAGSVIEASQEYFLAAIENGTDAASDVVEKLRNRGDSGLPVAARNWRTFLSADADILLGIHSLPSSAFLERHSAVLTTVQSVLPNRRIAVASAMAGADTPGIDALQQSRQAAAYGHKTAHIFRRTVQEGDLGDSVTVLVGSGGNQLHPGFATHAEFRALQAMGLRGEQVLHAAGKNIAESLGLVNQLGTLSSGSLADLVLVQGDPLENIDDAINIVAVVRNGRFFSLVRLLEQGNQGNNVE